MARSAVPARTREWLTRFAPLLPLPAAYAAVREVLEDPHGSSPQMCHAIEAGPGLAARLLSLLGGPLHAPAAGAPWSIDRAVSQLGMQRVVDLSLVALAPAALVGIGAALTACRFWHHAARGALAARLIAEESARSERDRMFCAGLLMPVGLALLSHARPRLAAALDKRPAGPMAERIDAERAQFGTDHVALSAILARYWHLPAPILRALAACDEPVRAVPHHHEAAVLKLARGVSGFAGTVDPPDALALDMLGLDESALVDVRRQMRALEPVYVSLLAGTATTPMHATPQR